MKQRVAKSFKGHIEQQKVRGKQIEKRIVKIAVNMNKLYDRLKKLPESEYVERKRLEDKFLERGAKKIYLFERGSELPSKMSIDVNSEEKTLLGKIRNEVRHRLLRDYANRNMKVTRPIAHVAASIKITTGADDRVALDRARLVVERAASEQIDHLEKLKEKGETDRYRLKRALLGIDMKAKEASDDILEKGEKSKYMQTLNYTTYKKKKQQHKEDDYAEGFKWLEK